MAATVSELQVIVSADTKSAESSLSSFSSKLGSVGGTMATAFGAAAIGGIVAVGGGLVAATASAAGFEKEMSGIKAVSGATGSEMEQLSALALQLGADTSFSASESAQGIGELLKAGVSLGDVMGGGAAAALNLAAAGAISVKEAATQTSNALNAFGLAGKDAGHVADVIAGAANASAIDVGEFGFSLASVGAVAHAVGFSFDDTAGAIALMGQAGIKGSDAGTSLKTMFLNLQPTTKAQISLFKELGITTADGSNRFFDAAGNVKSMSEVAGILKTSLGGLTKQQQLMALETIFGSDAIRAAAVFVDQGSEGYDKMRESMSKVTAEAVAQERLNNLAGAWEAFTGSLETAGIKIGMSLLPPLKDLVQTITEGLNGAMPILEEVGGQIGSALTDGISQAKDALRQLGDAWGTVKQVFAGDWSPDASIEPLALAAGNAATAIKDLWTWLSKIGQQASNLGALDSLSATLASMTANSAGIAGNIEGLASSLGRLGTSAGTADEKVTLVASALAILAAGTRNAVAVTSIMVDSIVQIGRSFVDLQTIILNTGKTFLAWVTGNTQGMEDAKKASAEAFLDMITSSATWKDRTGKNLEEIKGAFSDGGKAIGVLKTDVKSTMEAASQAVSEGSSGMQQFMEANGAGMVAAATTAGQGVATATETGMTQAVGAVDNSAPLFQTAAERAAGGVVTAVETQSPLAVAAAEGMGTGMSGALEAAAPAMASAAETGATGAVAAVEGQTGAASGAGQSLGEALGSGLEGGIMAYVGRVAAAARSMVAAAIGAGNAEAEAHSPSKKTEKLGKDLADGLEIGLASSNIGADMQAKIRDFIEATREYIPVAGEIARVEQEIKDIRGAAQTDALFRGQDMITIDSELLRLKKEQTEEERRLLPIRQDLQAADRDIRDIAAGSLPDRTRLLELETQHKVLRLASLDLEKQLLAAGKDETRKKQIQSQIDALRDQDRALGIEQDRIRTTNDLASTSARMRSLGLGDILAAEERNSEAIGRAIAVLGAEKSVFEANEATIKNATDNEIGYRNRLIAVFTAEGKPLADRMAAGKLLLEQLHNEGAISDELYNAVKKATDGTAAAGVATTGMGAAIQAAGPKLTAITAQQNAMAQSAAELAQREAQAAGSVSALASSLGKLPSWFTPKGGSSSSSGSLFSPPSLSVPTYTAPTQSGGYPGGSIVPGQTTVPGGSIIPMSSSSSGPAMQTIRLDVAVGGKVSKRMVIEGYDLAVREGWTPGGLTG